MVADDDLTAPLSDLQYKALALMPIPSSILSILGSLAIISMARRSRMHKHWTPYTRLLIGLSASDILLSLHLMVGNFLRPTDSTYRIWTFGNGATCTFSGFMAQLNFSAILYNSMLSFYFLLLSRLGISNRKIANRYEPWMHIISVGFPFLTACAGAIAGVFDEPALGTGCYVNNYPRNCGDGPEQSGEHCLSPIIGTFIGGIPWVFSFFSIVINNLIIFIFVWKKTAGSSANTTNNASVDRPKRERHVEETEGKKNANDNRNNTLSTKAQHSHNTSSSSGEDTESINISLTTWNDDQSNVNGDSVNNDSFSIDGSDEDESEASNERPSQRAPLSSKTLREQNRRLRLVRSQALLYVFSYLLSVAWRGLMMVAEGRSNTPKDEYDMIQRTYWIQFCGAIFTPLQGFWNLLIFMRPKYLKVRHDYPKESRGWAFWRALRGDSVKQQKDKKVAEVELVIKKEIMKPKAVDEAMIPNPNIVNDETDSKIKQDEQEQSDTFHQILKGHFDVKREGNSNNGTRSPFPTFARGLGPKSSDTVGQQQDQSFSSSLISTMVGIQPRRICRSKSRPSSFVGQSNLESIRETTEHSTKDKDWTSKSLPTYSIGDGDSSGEFESGD